MPLIYLRHRSIEVKPTVFTDISTQHAQVPAMNYIREQWGTYGESFLSENLGEQYGKSGMAFEKIDISCWNLRYRRKHTYASPVLAILARLITGVQLRDEPAGGELTGGEPAGGELTGGELIGGETGGETGGEPARIVPSYQVWYITKHCARTVWNDYARVAILVYKACFSLLSFALSISLRQQTYFWEVQAVLTAHDERWRSFPYQILQPKSECKNKWVWQMRNKAGGSCTCRTNKAS